MGLDMTFNEVLRHRNLDGDIYLCDMNSWLGDKISLKETRIIRDKLMEVYKKGDVWQNQQVLPKSV